MGALRYYQTATSDAAWDEAQQEQRIAGRTAVQLVPAYAWVETGADQNAKASYRFLHHLIDGQGTVGPADTRACVQAITQLNGARGGSDIPWQDRPAVYEHLARHIVDAGMTPPSLRQLDPEIDLAPTVERRYTPFPVEVRVVNDGVRMVTGYAAMFGKESRNLGGFVERVAPSFFDVARRDGWPDVLCRYNHKDDYLMGSTAGRTLRLNVDSMGLNYEVDPPKSRADVVELIERGDVRQSSFAFRSVQDEWTLTDQGYPLRTLHSGQIIDVAPCARAAYPDTTAAIRSLADHMGADPEEIRHLAVADELRNLWVRTSGITPAPRKEPKRIFGPSARAILDQRKEDPWA